MGVRRDVLPADPLGIVVALVDLHLVVEAHVVGDVDLQRAVAEGFHQLVVLQPLVLRLIGVADDELVDVRLRELLGLDGVLLRRAQEVVEERHVQLQDFDELDDAPVGDVELAVEIERARIGVAAELGDLPVVDVARQLRRVLVLLVFRLEGADADAVLLRKDQTADLDVPDHFAPVTLMDGHEIGEIPAAGRAQLAFHLERIARFIGAVDLLQDLVPGLDREKAQRLFVHGALGPFLAGFPGETVERAFAGPRIDFQALLDEAGDGRLRAADRPVQQEDAALGPVSMRGGLDGVDQMGQGVFEAEDGVLSGAHRILEEIEADAGLAVLAVGFRSVRQDHIVDALEGVADGAGVITDDLEIVFERAFPVEFLVGFLVERLVDDAQQTARKILTHNHLELRRAGPGETAV